MRTAAKILAILAICALLAPELRWASPTAAAETCSCPPNACMCPGHHHAGGHREMCAMANGGRCGVHPPDNYLASTLNSLVYMPTEHVWWAPAIRATFDCAKARLTLLPSHARIPDQPPRFIL
jgi:hypothetical protein